MCRVKGRGCRGGGEGPRAMILVSHLLGERRKERKLGRKRLRLRCGSENSPSPVGRSRAKRAGCGSALAEAASPHTSTHPAQFWVLLKCRRGSRGRWRHQLTVLLRAVSPAGMFKHRSGASSLHKAPLPGWAAGEGKQGMDTESTLCGTFL